jgi:LAO/AO transport system kinase
MYNTSTLITKLHEGDTRALARCISIVENDADGAKEILTNLKFSKHAPIVGITGPPGAGKSTLINAVVRHLTTLDKKVGIIAVDPTSPFNYGSLLGDRLRMSEHFNNNNVFIRSIATRGSLGGLSAKILEIVDVMRASDFDYIIVETVGVGQSEVEIVGLADTTVLVLVPEAGDEIQTIKSGVMEIADIYIVNKSDRDGAATFVKNLQQLVHSQKASEWTPTVIKAVATKFIGINELVSAIDKHSLVAQNSKKKYLLTEKAYHLLQNHFMRSVNKQALQQDIAEAIIDKNFNLYVFIDNWLKAKSNN